MSTVFSTWIGRRIEWWRETRFLWYDFAEIWTQDREDFLLIWMREIAVGFFLAVVFTVLVAVWAPNYEGRPAPKSGDDAIWNYMQHTTETQMALLNERVTSVEKEQIVQAKHMAAMDARQDEDTWYRRFVIGQLCVLVIGVAGLFAKIRMGGTRR